MRKNVHLIILSVILTGAIVVLGMQVLGNNRDKVRDEEVADMGYEAPVAVGPGNQETEPFLSNESSAEIDTSDWETYRNEEYGFSVRYPENFQLTEYDRASQTPWISDLVHVFSAVLYERNSGQSISIGILRDPVRNLELEQFLKWHFSEFQGSKFEKVSLNDTNGVEVQRRSASDMRNTIISRFFGYEAYIVALETSIATQELHEQILIYDEIVSTFQID